MTPENQGSAVCRLTGEVNVPSGATVRMQPWNSICMEIASELTGAGDFWVYGRTGTSNLSGSLELLGLNTNFFGRIGVNELVQPSKDSPRMDRYYQTLYLNDPRNLGGRLETFDPKALTVMNMCKVYPRVSMTLASDVNRGIFVDWVGRIEVPAEATFRIDWPLAVDGALWKEGDGTLVLGNETLTFGADGTATEPGADATNHLFMVAGGTVQVAAVDAVNGLDIVFTNLAQSLAVDLVAATGDFATYGIRNVKTDHPFARAGNLADLTLAFVGETAPTEECTRAVFTVKQECYEDAAAVFTVTTKSPSYKGWTVVTSRRDNDDGTATMVAELKRPGLVILVK